jgi:hypothetical protein
MECPIKNHAFESSPYKTKHATRDCIQDKCEWWMPSLDCCCMTAIAMGVYNNGLIDRGSFAEYAKED